jgi:hypothetical protein
LSANSVNYNFSDFTHSHYRSILTIAKGNYEFISYDDIQKKVYSRTLLCRHDVDISMNNALHLAKIESELNVKSTFFLLLHSEFYNLFEKSITNLVFEILSLGHNIGLHFDTSYYNIDSRHDLEYWLNCEKEMLQKIFKVDVNVFSFHNPNAEILMFNEWSYAGMVNTYANDIKKDFDYCSDSNGYWRYKRIYDVISKEKPKKLQILTHPEWWTEKVMSPKQKIWLFIEKRAENNKEIYVNALTSHGRDIIDW